MQTANIFVPFFIVMLLTMVVWFYMYAKRIPFIQRARLPMDQLTPAGLAAASPPDVANPSDNLKNLFEVPVIFYALVLYLHFTGQVDSMYVTAAWVFAIFRIVHSAVHCTINIVLLRFWVYAISTLAVWFMLVRAAWRVVL
jgi:hypothetical protein